MTMVATDSYRLAVKTTKLETSVPERLEANVPARALRELARLIEAGGEDSLSVWLTRNQAIFRVGQTSLSSRLIDGQFPNHSQLLPESYEHEVKLPRAELLEVTRRVSQLAQRNAALRLSFSEGELVVSAETPDLGDAREALPAPYSGELLEIGFNPEFVRDGLESIDADEVVLKLISPLRPGLLEPAEGRRLQLPGDADSPQRVDVMVVGAVECRGFRNLADARDRDRGRHRGRPCGPNGAGKTNLLEAVYFGLTGALLPGRQRPGHDPLRRAGRARGARARRRAAALLAALDRSGERRHLLGGQAARRATRTSGRW